MTSSEDRSSLEDATSSSLATGCDAQQVFGLRASRDCFAYVSRTGHWLPAFASTSGRSTAMLTGPNSRGRHAVGCIVAAIAAVASSCSSATGPTVASNAQLIARFALLSKTAPAVHSNQLRAMAAQLATGAPVGRVRIVMNGTASTYSIIAESDVNDQATAPFDSLLTIYAWSGEDADTIVEFDVGDGISVLLTDGVDLFVNDSVLAPTGLRTSTPGSPCPTVDVTLPSNITVVKGDNCRRETVTFSTSSSLSASAGLSLDLDFSAQSIAAIRQEFYDAVP